MMAQVIWEGHACECCTLMIANGDDSGCRDYYGHTHRTASLNERAVRQLTEVYGEPAFPWDAWTVVSGPEGLDDDGTDMVMGCDFCEQDGYMEAHRIVIIH